MITVEDAQARIWPYVVPLTPSARPLGGTLGLVLAQDIISGRDSPPFDKALADGYAVMTADFVSGTLELEVLELVTAGQVPTRPVVHGTATRIMTGAPIPAGADAVVMSEQAEMPQGADAGDRVRIRAAEVRVGQNIMRRGASLRRGTRVLEAGHELRPAEMGLLAEIGVGEPLVHPRPRVGILATGNELVPHDREPGDGQICNSNGVMLRALVERAGGVATDFGIGRDDPALLQPLIQAGLENDVLLVSGGVSVGVLDLVPAVLETLGVRPVFHRVQLKPGKPLWFGVLPTGDRHKLVFGLPGNPCSSLVCFELFVRPALARLAGRTSCDVRLESARLASDLTHRGDRLTFLPARTFERDGETRVELIEWRGSADLRTLARANCLVRFPVGERQFTAGELVSVYVL
jgi:molybdopterin molybdotransferase